MVLFYTLGYSVKHILVDLHLNYSGFIMGSWEIFEVSLHSWQRGANPSILWRVAPPFFKFCSTLPPTSVTYPTPIPTIFSVALFLWLNGWSSHIWCAVLLNDNIDLHMSSLGTLVSEVLWCVLCQFYWGLTHNVVFYQYSDLISHTHKHTHTTLTRMTHPCKYIFTAPAMCSEQLPLLH